jgi:hypothetical protein
VQGVVDGRTACVNEVVEKEEHRCSNIGSRGGRAEDEMRTAQRAEVESARARRLHAIGRDKRVACAA